MIIESLAVRGWRNYKEERAEFSPGINVFLGKNGQGKTNFLEAIYFLTCGQSPRVMKIEELIHWQEKYFYLKGEISRGGQKAIVEMGGARDGRRINKIDGVPLDRLAEISELLNAVFFMPEDLYLVKGSPNIRRSFLDTEIAKISGNYRYSLRKYKKFLQQRNALLKSGLKDKILLRVLTEKLAALAGPIGQHRQNYLQKLSVLARLKYRKLCATNEELNLQYIWSLEPGLSEQAILEQYLQSAPLEQRYKSTMLGPHKDDFGFLIDGQDLKMFGSQGQQRTAVLAVKLAEIDLIIAETKEPPVLLLDDVFSELDEDRKGLLLAYLGKGVQTFITSAEPLPAGGSVRQHWIDCGRILERI